MSPKEWVQEWLTNCLILDTETTGLGDDAEIVEIAIIDQDKNVLLNSLVKPSKPIPPNMYRAKNASLSTRDIVLRPQNDIPRAADNVFVEEHASGLYMLTFTGPNGRVIRVIAEEIASTYVAYEHLFTQFEPTAIQGIAVDPRYVSLATKLWPEGIRMTFSGAEKPILVQSIGRTESMLIMPKKVPN